MQTPTATLPSRAPPASAPIATIDLLCSETMGQNGFMDLTATLLSGDGERIRAEPSGRARIEVGLEPPAPHLEGRTRRRAFAGQASFRLFLSPNAAEDTAYRLSARVVGGDAQALSGTFRIAAWAPLGAQVPPPVGEIPAQLFFEQPATGPLRPAEAWPESVSCLFVDFLGRIVPMSGDRLHVVELSLCTRGGFNPGRGVGPVIARQAVRHGVARFCSLRAPEEPGTYSFKASVVVPLNEYEWGDIEEDESPDIVIGVVEVISQLKAMGPPFVVEADRGASP